MIANSGDHHFVELVLLTGDDYLLDDVFMAEWF